MFTGTSLSLTDSEAIGRLLAAGLLYRSRNGLSPTPTWEKELAEALAHHPNGTLPAVLQQGVQRHFPDAAKEELRVLAKTMLAVEARTAGWKL